MDTKASPEFLALSRAAAALGGQSALATACGYEDRRSVWPWFNTKGRRVPAEKCPDIERATTAAGNPVRCEELRPDVNWGVLRSKRATDKA